ncbi:uncharacterized protein LOC106173264 [Lingula anatina]|uniref:Uncharacterized protein LOC106173264 n=1 Tax=Lingula anatina TaxID=7574 RepID=A0A1S3JH98_LINAN|nr:uncharacterized protein LOC106173264 [Lingula anatina]|eukprot:XP_013409785.1 uncharacterized protein LOC106173264 [Lingula anatina]
MADIDYNLVIKYIKDKTYPVFLDRSGRRNVRKRAEDLHLVDGVLMYTRNWARMSPEERAASKARKVLITVEEKREALLECHIDSNGVHSGIDRTVKELNSHYYWKGMWGDCKRFIRLCMHCQTSRDGGAGQNTVVDDNEHDVFPADDRVSPASRCWQKVKFDFLGPFTRSSKGSCYILVCVDKFSMWTEAAGVQAKSPAAVALFLLKYIARFGMMECLETSEGQTFCSQVSHRLQQFIGDPRYKIDIGEPSQEGKGTISAIHDALRKLVTSSPFAWDQHLDLALLPHRISRSLQTEYSPFYLLYGRDPKIPTDMIPSMGDGSSDITLSAEQIDTVVQKMLDIQGGLQKLVKEECTTASKKRRMEQKLKKEGIIESVVETALTESEIEVEKPKRGLKRKKRKNKAGPKVQTPSSWQISADIYHSGIKQFLTDGTYPENYTDKMKEKVSIMLPKYIILYKKLYYVKNEKAEKKEDPENLREVIEDVDDRNNIIERTHTSKPSGHLSDHGTYLAVSTKYCWGGLRKDVLDYVKKCQVCMKRQLAPAPKKMCLRRDTAVSNQQENYAALIQYMLNGTYPSHYSMDQKRALRRKAENHFLDESTMTLSYVEYDLDGDKVFRKVVTNEEEQLRLIKEHHGSEHDHHVGRDLTYNELKAKYFWPGISNDVRKYVDSCAVCSQADKSRKIDADDFDEDEEDDVNDEAEAEENVEILKKENDATEETRDTKKKRKAGTSVKPKQEKVRFKCETCCQEFRGEVAFQSHIAQHKGVKPFSCTVCGKGFTERKYIKIHMRIHTGEKPYVCSVCGRGFIRVGLLNQHMDIHNEVRAHLCGVCGKSFNSRQTLQHHSFIHTGESPYQCNVCHKHFSRKTALKYHMMSHTGERPHTCLHCGKGFTTPAALREHDNIHTGNRPFKCRHCGVGFAERFRCRMHEKSHTEVNTTVLTTTEGQVEVDENAEGAVTYVIEDGGQAPTPGVSYLIKDAEGVQYEIVYGEQEVHTVSEADFSAINLLANVTDQVQVSRTVNPSEETPL